jgi:N-acetyl-anhydromuramyl-L-alanine amidase AmpD
MFTQNHLPKGQYIDKKTKKEWLFLHHTAGWDSPVNTINAWAADQRGAVATEFVIGGQRITDGRTLHDGKTFQAFPEGFYGWHLGTGNTEMHRNSVGIEVCNFGALTRDGYWKTANGKRTWVAMKSESFYTYVGTEAHAHQIVELKQPFKGFKFWHRYSDAQLKSLKELILLIAKRDSIDVRKGLPELVRQRGASAFDVLDIPLVTRTKGLWNHTNVKTGKIDMFPQQELLDLLLSL